MEADLLAAIAARPDDDEPRLLYADVLLERGDPRGELIAVQCARTAAERAAAPGSGADRSALRRREAELLAAHEERWREEAGLSAACVSLRRGLADEVVMNAGDFLAAEQAFFRLRPLPRLRLGAVGPETALRIASLPALAALGALALEGWGSQGDAIVKALCASRWLGALTSLRVASLRLGPGGVKAIARAVSIARLTRLDLSHAALDAASAPALAAVLERFALGALVLRGSFLDPDAVGALAAAAVGSLATLNLARNEVGDDGARALASSPRLGALRELVLWDAHVETAGAVAIARSPGLAALEAVDLGANPIGDDGAVAIAAMPALRSLGLADADVGEAGALAIAAREGELDRIDLRANRIGPRAAARLRERYGDRVHLDPPGDQ